MSFTMAFVQVRLALHLRQYCEKCLLGKGMILLPSEKTNTFYPLFPSSHNG